MWTGVKLADVLRLVQQPGGSQEEAPSSASTPVELELVGGDGFYLAVPLEHAQNPDNDVLLAYGMNGHALPADHGFPLRAVVPGLTGCRSVKWLETVRIPCSSSAQEDGEEEGEMQQRGMSLTVILSLFAWREILENPHRLLRIRRVWEFRLC